LGPELKGRPLPEDGPQEVARAAFAFNAMQRRIADHLTERIQILRACGYGADLLDNPGLREKLQGDLNAMQALVEEGHRLRA
jgi:hypothetical protein